jgi:hypothetical protein
VQSTLNGCSFPVGGGNQELVMSSQNAVLPRHEQLPITLNQADSGVTW